uniref:ACT domain-containing protein n=1 Tax=Mesocestoides corti TaxID=53468 RepID=A0A5K3G5J6_MESCO
VSIEEACLNRLIWRRWRFEPVTVPPSLPHPTLHWSTHSDGPYCSPIHSSSNTPTSTSTPTHTPPQPRAMPTGWADSRVFHAIVIFSRQQPPRCCRRRQRHDKRGSPQHLSSDCNRFGANALRVSDITIFVHVIVSDAKDKGGLLKSVAERQDRKLRLRVNESASD